MKQSLYLAGGILIGALAVSAPTQTVTEDPVQISPQYYTVKFENDRVRVLEYRLKPGEKEPMHSHPAGVVYYLSDSTARATLPDGTSTEGTGTRGAVSVRPSRAAAPRRRPGARGQESTAARAASRAAS